MQPFHSLGFYSFLLLLVWAPLPFASNQIWSAMLLVLLISSLLVWQIVFCTKTGFLPKALVDSKPVLICFACLLAWQLFQLAPLPIEWLSLISPRAWYFYSQLPSVPEFASIHLNWAEGWQAVLQSCLYMASFLLALLLINTPQKLKIFTYTIILSAASQAGYGVYMVLSGSESLLLGVSSHNGASVTGTFANRNHLAAYLNIGLALGVGLLLGEIKKGQFKLNWRKNIRDLVQLLLSEKAVLRLLLVVIVIGLVMTHSRMGNTAFAFSLIILAVVYSYKTRKVSPKAILFFASIILIDAMVVGHWFGFDRLVERLEGTTIEEEKRYEMVINSEPLLQDFSLIGSGMEAFPNILPFYNLGFSPNPFVHAHNDYLELLVSLGVIGFSCLLLAAFFIWRAAWRQKKPPYAVFMALAYIALHSTVEFNNSIPAVMMTFSAMLALAFIQFSKRRRLNQH